MERKKKPELTPVQKFGRAMVTTELITDCVGVLFLLAGLGLIFIGLNDATLPEQGFVPYLASFFPSMADVEQASASVMQMGGGAVLLVFSALVLMRSRLPHKG
jgi:hypothetical protein